MLPAGVDRAAGILLLSRALRGFADGYVAVLLPSYLHALGFGLRAVGFVSSATLLGSALATLAVGAFGHRMRQQHTLLLGAALLMALTGLGFASLSAYWPLLLVAFVGTLNPSSGDVSVFLPLEQARLSSCTNESLPRTTLFARYTVTGSLCVAVGALASGLPLWLTARHLASSLTALRLMFWLYAAIGLTVALLYRHLAAGHSGSSQRAAALGPSKYIVWRLAALFCVDAFAGGLLVNALLAAWLYQRFGLSIASAGQFFFWAGLLTTASQWLAPWVARRIGLLNTMVFTHIPASVFLILAALAPSLPWALLLLFARSALSQMDVPTRTAYVMAVVTPEERAAAASFTAVPRSLASALGPSLGGALMASGALAAPLIVCGILKIAYDLALWRLFRRQAIE